MVAVEVVAGFGLRGFCSDSTFCCTIPAEVIIRSRTTDWGGPATDNSLPFKCNIADATLP
jgi:hypothetical protein